MLNPTIKSKVNELWNKFWSGGISNPLNAIEQITYLLFIKQLEENDTNRMLEAQVKGEKYFSIFSGLYYPPGVSKEAKKNGIKKSDLKWSKINIPKTKTKDPSDEIFLKMQTLVFPFIKELGKTDSFFAKHMQNAVFLIPKASLLKEAMDTIDELFVQIKAQDRFTDTQGDVYEYLLDQLNTAGKNGQFRTPPHIIELMVELISPKITDRIADPACGTSGFLLAALKYIITQFTSKEYTKKDENGFLRGSMADKFNTANKKKLQGDTFYGFDIDPTMIRLGLMNLMMHGIDNPKIDYTDTLSKDYNEDNYYNVVLANPPFTGSLDSGTKNKSFTIDTNKTELLFIERIYKMLKNKGIAGVIVPQGVLFGSGKAFLQARKLLIDKCELKAVIAMPSGVFKPYAGVATAILIFIKGGETKNVWFYDIKSDGRTLDDKRNELTNADGSRNYGDLHHIKTEYDKKKKNTDRALPHFTVPKAEIEENDYDLSVSKYKQEVYEEVSYDAPQDILKQLSNIETEIVKGIEELKAMV